MLKLHNLGLPLLSAKRVEGMWRSDQWNTGDSPIRTLASAALRPMAGWRSGRAFGCGTCAIAAYRQEEFDRFLGLDGEEELVVYLAPVGEVERV
jgi:hypothetical protein